MCESSEQWNTIETWNEYSYSIAMTSTSMVGHYTLSLYLSLRALLFHIIFGRVHCSLLYFIHSILEYFCHYPFFSFRSTSTIVQEWMLMELRARSTKHIFGHVTDDISADIESATAMWFGLERVRAPMDDKYSHSKRTCCMPSVYFSTHTHTQWNIETRLPFVQKFCRRAPWIFMGFIPGWAMKTGAESGWASVSIMIFTCIIFLCVFDTFSLSDSVGVCFVEESKFISDDMMIMSIVMWAMWVMCTSVLYWRMIQFGQKIVFPRCTLIHFVSVGVLCCAFGIDVAKQSFFFLRYTIDYWFDTYTQMNRQVGDRQWWNFSRYDIEKHI